VRRNVGLVLVGVAAFFLALGALVRFYVANQVIAAPANFFQQSTLEATGASYLDTATLKMRTGARLRAVNTVRGDARAATHKLAVWDCFTSIEDPATKKSIEIQQQRAAFDRRNGTLHNVKGASVGGDTGVRQSGIGTFWPIGVKKHSYPYFDLSTKRAWPATFEGTQRVEGIETYRFVQKIPPTVTESVKGGLPAAVLKVKNPKKLPGYDKKTGNVAVDRVYAATVTLWVDPRTGGQVSQEQKVRTVLRTKDGVDRLVAADLDLKMTEASQKALAKVNNHQAKNITLVRTVAPLATAAIGLILLVVGLVLAVPGRQTIIPEPVREGPAPEQDDADTNRADGLDETARPNTGG
jgi:Porin PorA